MNAPAFRNASSRAHAQRAAFFGIGGAAQFVDQHQRIRRGAFQHGFHRKDVRGKRAEAFLNRLVIADVGQHLVEQRELGFGGGHRQPGVRHQREQADGLQCDRLAAGIRAADEQCALGFIESDSGQLTGTTLFSWLRNMSSSSGWRASRRISRRAPPG